MKKKYWKKLSTKKLAEELSAIEELEFNSWIKSNPENEILFRQLEKVWNNSIDLDSNYTPDTDKLWEKLKTTIESQNSRSKIRRLSRVAWIRIAAAVLAIAVMSIILKYYMSDNKTDQANSLQLVEIVTKDSTRTIYLPDSSKVILNKSSSLAYAKEFADTVRATYLSGEAYFEVTKGDKRFITYAGGMQVTVKGTAYNVKANESDAEMEVIVIEGKVSFKEQGSPQSKETVLEKNDKILYNKKKKSVSRSKASKDELWWENSDLEKDLNRLFKKIKRKIK